jgi:peptidyl-dipeptidase Dcp
VNGRAGEAAASRIPGLDASAEALLAPWTGPCGGTPPFDRAEPSSIESAYRAAIARRREEVAKVAADPEPPTFGNTVEALEDAGRALRRVECLFTTFTRTRNTGEMREVKRHLAPLAGGLEDEIARDETLFARVEAVARSGATGGLADEQRRLAEVTRDRLKRRGAGLGPGVQGRLAEIHRRLAEASAAFGRNLLADEDAILPVREEAQLEGLGDEFKATLSTVAGERGLDARWAVPNTRALVTAVLSASPRRELREAVWRMWTRRGRSPGPRDNAPVVAEILRLRGEKARLLGFPSYAHLATADRLAGSPEAALALVRRVWDGVSGAARARLAEMQALADSDGAGYEIAPWDRRYWARRFEGERLAFDPSELTAYLPLESLLGGVLHAASRLTGLEFAEAEGIPGCHPDVRVYAVRRDGTAAGLVWFDLFARPGKSAGAWMAEYRAAESFRGRVLPLVSVNLNLQAPPPGAPALLSWEEAGTLFHEVGHALHMLCSGAAYPSLGSFQLAPDALELPSLLNERWLATDEVLDRFARHHRSGEPLPPALRARIEEARTFAPLEGATASLDYLATAMVDLAVHLAADGGEVDPVAVEEETLASLGLPASVDPLHRVTQLRHAFAGIYEDRYAAGYYCYLQAQVAVADVAEAFEQAPGGFYDGETAGRYVRSILAAGHGVPADEAFRSFRGRDPEHEALLRWLGVPAGR